MYAYYHNCDPVAAQIVTKYDKLMPRFVKDIAGQITGMPGIFISCVFSASLSTVSAALHCISGVIYSDYIIPLKLFKHNDVNANRAMRLTIFLLGSYMAFSGLLVKYFSSLFQAVNTVAGITTGAKFGTFTLAMLYPWANQKVFLRWKKFFFACSEVTEPAILRIFLGSYLRHFNQYGSSVNDHNECPIQHCNWQFTLWSDTNINVRMC